MLIYGDDDDGQRWVTAIGLCVRCGESFVFNPKRVPSLRLEGVRRPLCELCYWELQALRKAMNAEPWPAPMPGAWGPLKEEEMG